MLSLLRAGKRALTASSFRTLASSALPERKVAILGAAGGIGQPLSLLMKVKITRLTVKDRSWALDQSSSVGVGAV